MNPHLIKFLHDSLGSQIVRINYECSEIRFVPHLNLHLNYVKWPVLMLMYREWLLKNKLQEISLPPIQIIVQICKYICDELDKQDKYNLFEGRTVTIDKESSYNFMFDATILEQHRRLYSSSKVLSDTALDDIQKTQDICEMFTQYMKHDNVHAKYLIKRVMHHSKKQKQVHKINNLDISKIPTHKLETKRSDTIPEQMDKLRTWDDILASTKKYAELVDVIDILPYAGIDCATIKLRLVDKRIIICEAFPFHMIQHIPEWSEQIIKKRKQEDAELELYYLKKKAKTQTTDS